MQVVHRFAFNDVRYILLLKRSTIIQITHFIYFNRNLFNTTYVGVFLDNLFLQCFRSEGLDQINKSL